MGAPDPDFPDIDLDRAVAAFHRAGVRGDESPHPLPTADEAQLYAERLVLLSFDAAELADQKPLEATTDGAFWKVKGSALPTYIGLPSRLFGGPLVLTIRKSDGHVVSMYRLGPNAPAVPSTSTSQ